MKPLYLTVYMTLGGRAYTVDCRILPPRAEAHVGADSPRFLDPGSLPRVQVLRILADRVDVTDELTWWTKRAIIDEARQKALRMFAGFQQRRRAGRRGRRRITA